jgi:Zn-dependent protease
LSETAIASIFLSFAALLLSLSVHEAAHAWSADRLGDPTARLLGRISLNPLVHIDVVGTVVLPLLAIATGAPLIGWAKPVPVNGGRLGHPRRDFMLVAGAGPASNIVLAVVASAALRLLPEVPAGAGGLALAAPLADFAWVLLRVNLLLAVFNLIPVPPLDGGNILGALLPGTLATRYDAVRPYGILILYALMLSGAITYLIGPPFAFLARLLTL